MLLTECDDGPEGLRADVRRRLTVALKAKSLNAETVNFTQLKKTKQLRKKNNITF